MNYQSYLLDREGKKLPRKQRKGHQGRNHRNEVYLYNKKLHSKRHKRLDKEENI
jgi:hypothetical protein